MNRLDTRFFDWGLFRRDVRRDVRLCVWFTLFAIGVNLLVGIIVQSVGMAMNPQTMDAVRQGLASGGLSEAAQGAEDTMSGTLMALATMAGAVIGPLVFLIYRRKRFFGDLAMPARERLTPRLFIFFILGTQAVQLLYGFLVTYVDFLLKPTGISLQGDYSSLMDQVLFNPVGMTYVIAVGPVFEELVFRGALLGGLRRYGENFAIILSSLMFGFFHMVVLQIPFAFFIGLLLGYVASRYSLRASIALHMAVNALSTLLTMLPSSGAASTAGGLAMLACTVIFIVWLILKRRSFTLRVRAGAAYYDGTYRAAFSSIPLWIYLVLLGFVGVAQLLLMPGAS
ncbi:MAG: CPBP family intramembrane metalloprotease [Clostridiales bacterium]|nr:CPBP family intramembrane metalloprotease [Clostridiales bacterium]